MPGPDITSISGFQGVVAAGLVFAYVPQLCAIYDSTLVQVYQAQRLGHILDSAKGKGFHGHDKIAIQARLVQRIAGLLRP